MVEGEGYRGEGRKKQSVHQWLKLIATDYMILNESVATAKTHRIIET